MQAVNRLLEKAVNVRSEARDAYATYRAAYDIARPLSDASVLPLRKIIADETQLRYNGMLIDVFALLTKRAADRRHQRRGDRSEARLLARRRPTSRPP